MAADAARHREQHSRTTRGHLCPPASFWHAAHTHLTHPDDLNKLAHAASIRHRLQWAHHLTHRAADAGSTDALARLAELREKAGAPESAEALYREAIDAGSTHALASLAMMREKAGDREGAETLSRQAADAGNSEPLYRLVVGRERGLEERWLYGLVPDGAPTSPWQ